MFGIREALNYPLINDMGFIIPRIYPTFENKKYWVMIVYNRERGGATFYSSFSRVLRDYPQGGYEWSSREALTNVDAQHLDLYIPVIFDLAW